MAACSVLGKNRASLPIEIHSDRELDARNLRRKRKKRNELICLTDSLIYKRMQSVAHTYSGSDANCFHFRSSERYYVTQ